MQHFFNYLINHGKKSILATTGAILLILLCALPFSRMVPIPASSRAATEIPAPGNMSSTDRTSKSANRNTKASTGKKVPITGEMRGIWIAFFEYNQKGYTESQWKAYVDKTMNDCKAKGFNSVFMHVRAFSDAMYPSKYYPWSRYASGKIGRSPGFDPLAYAVSAAHKKGLSFHAWINPYRVTKETTKTSALAKGSTIYKWATSKRPSKRRNVLKYGNQLYLNPATKDVQKLVTNGVAEIVERYNVDGIHFDDYFYPSLGNQYRKTFDAKEYKAYVKKCKKKKTTASSIVTWRRNNVSNLLKGIHAKVKKIDKDCVFGISPAGNLDNLYAKNNYYADVRKWMGSDQYIDYICPQIYWSFQQSECPYKATTNEWCAIPRHAKVKMYIGIAGYRAGISKREARAIADPSWSKSNTILKRQVEYLRSKKCNGFVLFSNQDLSRSTANKEMQNLRSILSSF